MSGLFLWIALLLPAMAWAGGAPGSRGFEFVQLGVSARQEAMGGGGLSLEDLGPRVSLNPAILGSLKSREVSFTYQRLFDESGVGFLGYAVPTRHAGNFAFGFQYLDFGKIAGADVSGAPTSGVSASDRLLSVSWAPRRDLFIPGLTLKLVQENLADVTATALALDAGLIFQPEADWEDRSFLSEHLARMRFAVSLLNLGTSGSFDDAKVRLPLSLRAGISHRSFGESLTFVVDLERSLGRRQGIVLHAGGELLVRDALFLRGGFRTGGDLGSGLAGGVGFNLALGRLDYAFSPFSNLGESHKISLGFRFGRDLLNLYYRQGMRELRLGRYAEAIIQFDKALQINSRDRRVMRGALEAARALKKAAAGEAGGSKGIEP